MNTATDNAMTIRGVADYLRVHQCPIYRLAKGRRLFGFEVEATGCLKRVNLDRWADVQATTGLLKHKAKSR